MSLIYLAARTFPIWAVALAIALFPAVLHFRRRRKKLTFLLWGAFSGALVGLAITWIVMRGDLHAETWVRTWVER
jgi:hypothetical protein